MVGVVLGTTLASASTRSNAPVDDPARDYWREAQSLTQEQVRLLDRVERAAKTPEANRLKTLTGQIFLHAAAVDRFLKTNYPESDLLCSPSPEEVAGTDSATLEQIQVYCSFYRSAHDLTALRFRLAQQAKLISTVGAKPAQNYQTAEPIYQASARLAQAPSDQPAGITASSREVLSLVESSRQRLSEMQPAFPEALRTSIPNLPGQSADLRSR